MSNEEYYRMLFTSMSEGFCIIEMIFDNHNRPVDYLFLEINPAFEAHTGLHNAQGKRMRELIPNHEEHWFEKYGHVALTGEPVFFEDCSQSMNRCFDVHAFRVEGKDSRKVAILFNDISERRKTQGELQELTKSLEIRVEERTRLLELQANRLKTLTIELTEAEQNERKRLAEILHDSIQQLLVAAKIRLNLLERKIEDKKEIKEAGFYIDQAFEASRSLTTQLSPPALYQEGLSSALELLAKRIEEQYKIKVHVNLDPDVNPEEFIKVMIYQCVQELLFNVVKYAKVDECQLTLQRGQNKIILNIEDQGVGFEASRIAHNAVGGFGLYSIKERVKVLGGEFKIVSSFGQGTRCHISIPEDLKSS
jgi:signal transduction histidine kinase